MALYYLEYDVRSRNHDYQPMWDELKKFSAVRILKSLWCFSRVNTNAANLRDHFKKFIHQDDGLSVAEVTDWATFNAEGTAKQLAA